MPPPRSYRISRVTAPAESLDLVSIDDAKIVLGIDPDDTTQDAQIEAAIHAISARICRYCDRQFVKQGYRDEYRNLSLDWVEPLRCWQFPLVVDGTGAAVLAVSSNGSPIAAESYEANPDNGALFLWDGCWCGAVTLDYTAGFDPIPPELQSAALSWLIYQWSAIEASRRDPTIRSETVSDAMTITYASASSASGAGAEGPPGFVCAALSGFVRWSL